MARRSLNELMADNGYGLMLGLGILLVVAGAGLIAAGRDGSPLVWMGGILVALGALAPRLESFKIGPSGGEATFHKEEAVLMTLNEVAAEVAPASASAAERSAVEPTFPSGSRISVPIAGSYWSADVVRQAAVAAGSNSMGEFAVALKRLDETARLPGSFRFEAEALLRARDALQPKPDQANPERPKGRAPRGR